MRRAAALACAAFACALGAPPAHAIDVTRAPDATGVSINGLFDSQGRLQPHAPAHAELIAASGIRFARADALWSLAEPRAPILGIRTYSWGRLDDAVGFLAAYGLRMLPVLAYSTPWATSVPREHHAPPRDDADYTAYAAAFARRYGRGGEFWAERPDLTERAVTAYHVWNEPNLGHFWRPKPDAARYARMYRATRDAIRAVDPAAAVVLGGLSAHGDDYAEELYAAEPALRGNVDVVAYHPYGATPEHALKQVRSMRATLDRVGELAVPLWITEIGWPTQGRGDLPLAVPDRTRAGNLSLVTDALLGSNCDVDAVSAFQWVSSERNPDRDEDWLGIYRRDGSPTETGVAYREAVARNAARAGRTERALRLCGGSQRGGSFAKPLKLGLSVRSARGRCFAATATYRRRPVNGVGVTFTAGRTGARGRTGVDGTVQRCLPPAARGRRLAAAARVLDVAASATVHRRVAR